MVGKYFCIILAICMILTNTGITVTANDNSETVIEISSVSDKFKKYFVNDDFNTAGNVGNWKVGETSAVSGQQITVTQENLEENGETVGVMKFYALKNASNYFTKQQPYIDNDFTDIEFKTDSKIVIETRVKTMGDTIQEGVWTALKFNRPNQKKYLVENSNINYRGWNGGTLFKIRHDSSTSGIRYKSGSYWASSIADGDYRGKWVNVKVIIDGTDDNLKNYEITITNDEGLSVTKTNGVLTEQNDAMYDVPSAVDNFNYTSKSMHTELRNLSFVLREFAGTMYVDYFRVYEERDVQTATASVVGGALICPSDSVTVKFTSDKAIENFASGLVTIDGVECDMTSDVKEQTVTVTPKQKLTPNENYTLRINKDVLASTEGFILEGENEVTLKVSGVNVRDVVITGRIIPDSVMGVSYVYTDSANPEGAHIYRWQKSNNGISWTDIAGETGSTYTVSQDVFDNKNYIRVVMTPCDNTGDVGMAVNAEAVTPENAPVLENVTIDTKKLFTGTQICVSYDYFDLNGDAEVKKDVIWYSSDYKEGPWAKMSNKEYYLISESDAGKYLKCDISVTSDSKVLKNSETYESNVAGPVKNILTDTNLLVNPDFELGSVEGWDNEDGIIEIAGIDGARTGNYGVHLKPRSSTLENWSQDINGIDVGKRYIFGGWAKKTSPDADDIKGLWPYVWNDYNPVGNDFGCDVGNEWEQTVIAYTATKSYAKVDFVSFLTMNADCYLDDLYFGEILISDIETTMPESVTIPSDGDVTVPVATGRVLNQMGTTHGLLDEEIQIRVLGDPIGIDVDGNNIVISDSATAGTYRIELSCTPSYAYPAQDRFYKVAELELLDESASEAYSIDVVGYGDAYTVTCSNLPENCEIIFATYMNDKLVYFDSVTYDNSPHVPFEAEGAYDKVKVMVWKSLNEPIPLTNAVEIDESLPKALDAKILRSGSLVIGCYDYFSCSGDAEDGTLYEWRIDEKVVSTNIDYFIDFAGTKYVTFTVTPVSVTGEQGASVTLGAYITGRIPSSGGGSAGGGFGGSSSSEGEA